MNKKWILYAAALGGFALLLGFEIAKVYYIMPFPGSQQEAAVELAYWIHQNIQWIRWVGWALLAYPAYRVVLLGGVGTRMLIGVLAVFYLLVFYQFNFRLMADKMFEQPQELIFLSADSNRVERAKLVIGLERNGQAKAYPIEIIGYHHQVRDTVGGELVMVTYCTVCRTGRVFRPLVAGEPQTFRLVGMDQFNAMFEDTNTQSWWRQVNGEAVAGPLKGSLLEEVPAQQMSLLAWIDRYPHTLIMQPDRRYDSAYADLEQYDEGMVESTLEKRDTASWQEKSWVVGIQSGTVAKAYDWNDLLRLCVINDRVGDLPVVIMLEPDSVSFHAWQRDTLAFELVGDALRDRNTRSTWNWRGQCLDGLLKGNQLRYVQAYQEFWHSWRVFHSGTETYSKER
ncbi:MAG: DUF3179 domain-containing protein [Cyclobacteriaceae bacterium]|nr:DUF3179 domain-containing protein [Cyclobacteriaceae bacterium]